MPITRDPEALGFRPDPGDQVYCACHGWHEVPPEQVVCAGVYAWSAGLSSPRRS